MKIGFLLCAYNQEEFIHDCLRDLVKFSKENGHIISAASVPFKEYEDMGVESDDTTNILKERLFWMDIDYLIDEPKFISEAEARTLALNPILEEECTHLFMLDSDEIFSYEQLNNIVNFIAKDPFIDWYSISYKNYVGNGYLEEPFTPPRIFKVNVKGGKLKEFYWDNDLVYEIDGEKVDYKSLSNKIVPKEIANPDHFSWTNTEKNKSKIKYHEIHFGPPKGTGCSYKWDETQGIIINPEYYQKIGQTPPKIIYE